MKAPEDHKAHLAKRFYPLGVDNVAIFSQDEAELLSRYGFWLEALAHGQIQPVTSAQEQFVQVHHGVAKADSVFERAWLKLILRREIEPDLAPVYSLYDPGEEWFDRHAHWRYQ